MNKLWFFTFAFTSALGLKMCLELYMNTHTDGLVDANNSRHIPKKVCRCEQLINSICGKIWIPSCLVSSPFSLVITFKHRLSPFGIGPFFIISSFRSLYKVYKCISIPIGKFKKRTPLLASLTDVTFCLNIEDYLTRWVLKLISYNQSTQVLSLSLIIKLK